MYSNRGVFSILVFIGVLGSSFSIEPPTLPANSINHAIVIKSVDRIIDISSQLTKHYFNITVENNGKDEVNSFLFAIEPVLRNKVSYLSGHSVSSLDVNEVKIKGLEVEHFWQIHFKHPLTGGSKLQIEMECIFNYALNMFPASITQNERQYVRYSGNHYVYSPYTVIKQVTTVNIGEGKIESYSKLSPTSFSSNRVAYGPYLNVEPFAEAQLSLHYENNSPFLSVTRLERSIEVSHWGNIAIEESINLLHNGAQLKGSFSRVNVYANEGKKENPSVRKYQTFLPASASEVYYRDGIGNISTSEVKVHIDTVELVIYPRFPLFGGWKTDYVLGYNVPSYEYLFNLDDQYRLKMRLVDHIFDNMIIDEAEVKIILPEGSRDFKFSTQFQGKIPNDYHCYNYFDSKGRPVIVVKMKNLVEQHIQDFELDYVFPKLYLLHEPFLLIAAFYLVFLFVMLYVRLDFSIVKDKCN